MFGKKYLAYFLIVVILGLLIVTFTKFNPETTNLFPKCPFRVLTGYECPGCGSQRAIHYLLNLEMGRAFHENALLVLSIPYVLLLLLAEFLKSKSSFFMSIYKTLFSTKAIWTVFVIIMIWWVARNL